MLGTLILAFLEDKQQFQISARKVSCKIFSTVLQFIFCAQYFMSVM